MRIDHVKLVTIMCAKDISVNDLAEKSGVSRVTISSIRRGKTCSENTASKIADALQVNRDEIVAIAHKQPTNTTA